MFCPPGFITRVGYTTKKHVKVPASCIKDRGAPGKGAKLIGPLKKGTLGNYHYRNSVTSRHRALLNVARKSGYATTVRKLNAVRVLTRRTVPTASKVFKRDLEYLKDHRNMIW